MPILHWLNREESIKETVRVLYRLLKADPKLSYGDENTENILIQSDNLDALKALLPYNTKKDFGHYEDNLEHTKWLAAMFPRLELLRDLLSEEGSIWATIDDEDHDLKVIMDEIFGRNNFVANCVWQKKYSSQNDAKWLSNSHDHVLCFAKNRETWRPNPLLRTEAMDKRYKNPEACSCVAWKKDKDGRDVYQQLNQKLAGI